MRKIYCPECENLEFEDKIYCKKCGASLLLKNRYKLLEILGKNSAITYLAEDSAGNKRVIKELSYHFLKQWKSEELFQREINVLKQLNHKKIPKFIENFSVGVGKHQSTFLVQEFVEGISLKKEFESKRYTEKEILETLLSIFEVLDYLHNLQPPLIHRDIKLSNLIRNSVGSISLIDFGSVKDIISQKGDATISGTFGFMAPEVFKGNVSIKSDYYSVGVLSTVLLSRKNPEEMITDGIYLNWKDKIGKISEKTGEFIEKLLDINPENRIENSQRGILLIHEALNCLNQNKSYNSTSRTIEKLDENKKDSNKNSKIKKKIDYLKYNNSKNKDFEEDFYDLYLNVVNYFDDHIEIKDKYFIVWFIYTFITVLSMLIIFAFELTTISFLVTALSIFFYPRFKYVFNKNNILKYVNRFLDKIDNENSENKEIIIASIYFYIDRNIQKDKNIKDVINLRVDELKDNKNIDMKIIKDIINEFLKTKTGKKLL